MALPVPKILKETKFALVLLILALLQNMCCSSAFAFMTYRWLGGAIHRDILNEGLSPLGISQDSMERIGKGTDSQDTPLTCKYVSCPQNHCDDDQIQQGYEYWQERVKQAVLDAEKADTDHKRRDKALFKFGEGMHTVQDFYSHSNYLEWLLQNHKALDVIEWNNRPASIRTGYYYYDKFLDEEAFVSRARSVRGLKKKHLNLNIRPEAEYERRKEASSYQAALDYVLSPGDLLHKELNKDSSKTMEGRIVAPEYGKTLHAMARKLAIADTARQWKNFEQQICDSYGARAPQILAALKGNQMNQRFK